MKKMKNKEEKKETLNIENSNSTIVRSNGSCDRCGLPFWSTNTSELSCQCSSSPFTYSNLRFEPTNHDLQGSISELKTEIENLKGMIKQLITEVANKNIERAVNDIKFIMKKNEETK